LFLRGGDAVLEVEDDRIGAAARRALDKAALGHRYKQHRTPHRQVFGHLLRPIVVSSWTVSPRAPTLPAFPAKAGPLHNSGVRPRSWKERIRSNTFAELSNPDCP